jgi:adenosylcobinamide-GDP ribazoletransferase
MRVINAVITAFSFFSVIPMPQIEWDERNLRYMMAAFPLVGLVIGLLVWGFGLLAQTLGFGPVLTGAGYTLLPVMVTGGIHLDGFADVMDAQSSHASPERRREIMHDPHIGAFATMAVSCYLIAYLAFSSEVPPRDLALLACVPVISRCLSGLATVSFRTSSSQGMLASEQASAHGGVVRTILVCILALAAALMLATSACVSAVALACAAGVLAWVRHLAETHYGGMSGDLAGFFLQLAELAMLACIVVVGRVV